MIQLDDIGRKRGRLPSGEFRVAKLRVAADPSLARKSIKLQQNEDSKWASDMTSAYPSNHRGEDSNTHVEELSSPQPGTRKRPRRTSQTKQATPTEGAEFSSGECNQSDPGTDVTKANLHLNLLLKQVKEKASIQYSVIPDEVLNESDLQLGIWSVLVSDNALKRCSELHKKQLDDFEDQQQISMTHQTPAASTNNNEGIMEASQLLAIRKQRPLGITSLKLPGSEKVTDKGLLSIADHVGNLKVLDLAKCERVTDKAIRVISKRCGKSLERLDLSECPNIQGPGLASVGEHCHSITHLHLRHFIHFREWLLKRLVVGCASLCLLDLAYCDKLSDNAIKIIANRCRKLRNVNLSYCKHVSDVGILAISEYCHSLTQLSLARNELQFKITDVSLLGLAERCRVLEDLDLQGCDSVTDVGLNWLTSGCTSITKLNIANCFKITDVGMRAIAESCKLLTDLNLTELRAITDVGIRHVASGCPMLEKLAVTNLFLLTDGHQRSFGQEGLQYMSAACRHIKVLKLDGCFRVGKQVLASIGKQQVPLETLSMKSNPLVSSAALSKLLKGCGKTMKALHLSRCPRISDNALSVVGKYCPQLRVLDVSHDGSITNIGVHALVQGCKMLTRLNFQNCKRLHDLALLSVMEAKLNPGLTHLNLHGCENISETGVAWLTEMGSLRVLNLRDCQGVSSNGLKGVVGCWHHVHVRNDHEFFGIWPDERCTEKRLIDEYGDLYKAARLIQSLYRQRVARRELAARREEYLRHWVATKLQSVWRSRKARRYALLKKMQRDKEKEAAIRIQRQFRRKQAAKRTERLRKLRYEQECERAAIIVQRCYRGKKARDILHAARRTRDEYIAACDKAARMVQRVWRGREGRQHFALMKAAREAQLAEESKAAVNIQSVFRGRKARKKARKKQAETEMEALQREEAAKTIQKLVRGKLARKEMFGELLELEARRKAVVKIQSVFRSRKGRYMAYLRRQAAIAQREEAAAIRIQCRWRTRKGQLSAHLLRKAQEEEASKMQDSASKLQRLFRGKRGREHAKQLKNDLAMKLRRQDDLETWAAIKVQTKVRQRLAVKRAGIQKEKRMRRWKELFDKEQQRPFYYNQDTGEIRWRKPQALLDLLPKPVCNNCESSIATMECSNCTEFFCQECFGQVHFGGKRKSHKFRALYDAYEKRVDYGDGEFPSLWPTEIQQDEMIGWQSVQTQKQDKYSDDNTWEQYWDEEGMVYYYWNPVTEVSTYDRPEGFVTPRVEDSDPAAWGKYWDEQNALEFWYNEVTGVSTYDRPHGFVTPRELDVTKGDEVTNESQNELAVLAQSNAGWVKQYDDDSGKAFYHHVESGKSVFERPSGFRTPESKKPKKHPWIRAFDSDLGLYVYSHLVSGESQTDRPPGFLTPRPETWAKYYDDVNGLEFFYNEEMKVSQYERPPEYVTPRPDGYEEGNNGWVRYIYDSQVLYENQYSREIVYERPAEFDLPEKAVEDIQEYHEDQVYYDDQELNDVDDSPQTMDTEYQVAANGTVTDGDGNATSFEVGHNAMDSENEVNTTNFEVELHSNGGWEHLYDTETESWYYQHRVTGDSQFEKPEGFESGSRFGEYVAENESTAHANKHTKFENSDWSEEGCRVFFTDFRDNHPELEMIQTQPLRPPEREVAQSICDELGLVVQTKGVGKTRCLIVAKVDDEDET